MPGCRRLQGVQDTRQARDALRAKQVELAGEDIAAKVRANLQLTEDDSTRLRDVEYEAVSALPDTVRFLLLPDKADSASMWAEHLQYTKKDQAGADRSWKRSKQFALDALALALAPAFRDHDNYSAVIYRANVALGTHALREGDRASAVRYMLEASKAPPSAGLSRPIAGLQIRLVNYLLKAGERQSIITFLERSAELRPAERESLLKSAAGIREGRMPASYQAMLSRGH